VGKCGNSGEWAEANGLKTDELTCYSNTTVYYGIHERSECIPQ